MGDSGDAMLPDIVDVMKSIPQGFNLDGRVQRLRLEPMNRGGFSDVWFGKWQTNSRQVGFF